MGDLAGYTPGIEGSEDGDGKGAKGYEVTGMIDGPGSVSTLVPKVVSTEGDGGKPLPLEYDMEEGNGKEGEGKVECEGAAEARAAARRTRTRADHMYEEQGYPVN